ncbi:hypothetical protein GCG54_00014133 [Colletotrichum gloeosporioides]|uniref:Transcription factor domain-containing protein n=1 Tax=Colletotrichum gloeosporioides TaxID=474922 RepID=A0A8H4CTK5_COLGL|nr:uncharacterized protein GCG54_00014133 [Colletotrichum gloeosporioides]KAF3809919.1 hypothetical protein GCG54_00014133 [Colletotrichum gloeosporioides]
MAVHMTSLTDEGIHALQTMMLLTAFAAWSGTKEDLRAALQFHGRLAFAVRQEWALSEYGEGAETNTWEVWLARESLKRLTIVRVTFCIFTLMNLMTIAYDIPSPMLLEAQHGMPAHENQWCARTEVDWIEAMRCAGIQTWPSAQAIVERLVDESLPVPSHIGMFGCHVLISFLVQKIILLRRSCPTKDVIYLENRRCFIRALRRWQLMWESEPEASLSPDHPQGPILFNCTALLRVAYIRLVSDYSPIRRGFAASCSEDKIASSITGIEAPIRDADTTRAAIQACLALRVPTQLGFKMIARTSFWVWSVQHALSYFECALLLSKWLQANQQASDLSAEERRIRHMLEQTVGPSNGSFQAEESSTRLDVRVLKRWAELFKTENTTVWQIMPKMARILEIYADTLSNTPTN